MITDPKRSSLEHPLHGGTSDVPLESIISLTFTPAVPRQCFDCWLQPIGRVLLLVLLDPQVLRLSLPGKAILAGIAPTIHPRMAITNWHLIKFFCPLSIDALDALDHGGLACPSHVAGEAIALHFARKRASRELGHLKARPSLPRTLCRVPANAFVEPAATKPVWDCARRRQVSIERAYADMYTELCVSPRDNPTRDLLVDTRLVSHLGRYPGWPGSRGEFVDLGPFRGRRVKNPFRLNAANPVDLSDGCTLIDLARARRNPAGPLIASNLARVQSILLPFSPFAGNLFHHDARSALVLDGHAAGIRVARADAA